VTTLSTTLLPAHCYSTTCRYTRRQWILPFTVVQALAVPRRRIHQSISWCRPVFCLLQVSASAKL